MDTRSRLIFHPDGSRAQGGAVVLAEFAQPCKKWLHMNTRDRDTIVAGELDKLSWEPLKFVASAVQEVISKDDIIAIDDMSLLCLISHGDGEWRLMVQIVLATGDKPASDVIEKIGMLTRSVIASLRDKRQEVRNIHNPKEIQWPIIFDNSPALSAKELEIIENVAMDKLSQPINRKIKTPITAFVNNTAVTKLEG